MTISKSKMLLAGASGIASLACTGLAHANTVAGTVWAVTSAVACNATPSNVPGGAALATFTENSPLALSATSAAYTIGAFILSEPGGAFTSGASNSNNTLSNTFFNFTGTVSVTTGQTFTLEHDDGLTLVIGGVTVVAAAGPTAATNTTGTYTGASGNEAFQLVYAECCGPPAVLDVNLPLNSAVPIPAALPLFAGGLGLLGFLGKRRKGKIAAA